MTVTKKPKCFYNIKSTEIIGFINRLCDLKSKEKSLVDNLTAAADVFCVV